MSRNPKAVIDTDSMSAQCSRNESLPSEIASLIAKSSGTKMADFEWKLCKDASSVYIRSVPCADICVMTMLANDMAVAAIDPLAVLSSSMTESMRP
jgi:hypothetical protein